MTFQSEIVEMDGIKQVVLRGRLDSVTSEAFEIALQHLFEVPKILVMLDFTALDYISSAGLREVLKIAKSAKLSNSKLVLFGLKSHIKEVFQISGFLKIIAVEEDRNAAVQWLCELPE